MLEKLYQPYEPYEVRRLKVDARHELYLEQAGNPQGLPVLHLHGGPGFTWVPTYRRFCDPSVYRFIGYDQRGAHRSTPLGALEDNTTEHLIADMELIRETLGLERWVLFGGSWGSALSLAYAQRFPERVIGMALWGIYLGMPQENEFNYITTRKMFPEAWQALVDHLPPGERGDVLGAYYRRILNPDPAVHEPALAAWLAHGNTTSNYKHLPPNVYGPDPAHEVQLAAARIAITYFVKDIFLPPGQLLRQAGRLAGIPGLVTHGRDDFNCPLENAYDLHRAWPGSRYVPVNDAGHSAFEPGITKALFEALESYKTLR